MIFEIVTKNDCAKCKKCCQFDISNLADVPRFSKKLASYIKERIDSSIVFTDKVDFFTVELKKISESKYLCPFLDTDKGCRLADSRPLDCKLFPFYLMEYNGAIMISLSKDCPTVMSKSLSVLYGYHENEIDNYARALLKSDDFILEPYHSDAIILKVLTINK